MKRLFILNLLFLFIISSPFELLAQSKKEIKKRDQAIQMAIDSAYVKYKDLKEGANADYIPALAEVPSELFGIAVVTPDGKMFEIGDTDYRFSIQSLSKVFTMAHIIEEQGPAVIEQKVGVNPTGQVFNSIYPIEQHQGKGINPFVNPGAIATTSLVEGDNYDEIFNNILKTQEAFAGSSLSVDEVIYESEAATNQRNQAIAMLLNSWGRIYADPLETTDIYTRQCAVSVHTKDLAVMAGTLANGGKNPVTGEVVISPETTSFVLPMMTVAGLYDNAGFWLYYVGIPAKSGVGGGIIAVVPGKFGVAAFSPRLDKAGNSVRAQYAIYDIIKRMEINPYLVEPK